MCPYCGAEFEPSVYHREQRVCSLVECQRQRRAEYHRRKFDEDSDYRETCRNSQRNWRRQHPNYLKLYRAARREIKPNMENPE